MIKDNEAVAQGVINALHARRIEEIEKDIDVLEDKVRNIKADVEDFKITKAQGKAVYWFMGVLAATLVVVGSCIMWYLEFMQNKSLESTQKEQNHSKEMMEQYSRIWDAVDSLQRKVSYISGKNQDGYSSSH